MIKEGKSPPIETIMMEENYDILQVFFRNEGFWELHKKESSQSGQSTALKHSQHGNFLFSTNHEISFQHIVLQGYSKTYSMAIIVLVTYTHTIHSLPVHYLPLHFISPFHQWGCPGRLPLDQGDSHQLAHPQWLQFSSPHPLP